MMTRTRKITVHPLWGGYQCPRLFEAEQCNTKFCPVNCVMEDWNPWTTCDKTCGRGNEQRTRDIFTKARNGGKKCPTLKQARPCTISVCPVHCWVSGWSSWSKGSQTCGVGASSRLRKIVRQGKYGGNTCPALFQKKQCETNKCPVDCVVAAWGKWSTCTKTCTKYGSQKKGTQSHKRKVLRNVAYGGKKCPFLSQARNCATKPQFNGNVCPSLIAKSNCDAGLCPVHCTVSKWGAFGLCTKTCNGGSKTAYRTVKVEASNGGVQCPSLFKTASCNTQWCPVDCAVSKFGAWGVCSKTCGGGRSWKQRKV